MRRRLTGAILLLYPRRVRERHGSEIVTLIDDLIAHEGRSRVGLFMRLAADGLVQRVASTATVWTLVAVLAATSLGGLAVSDFAAASAFQTAPRTVHSVAPARHAQPTPRRLAPVARSRIAYHRAHDDPAAGARRHSGRRPPGGD
jgi:hypothetical protein